MKIVDVKITPVAVLDPPLRNSTGVHQKYALRTMVQLRTDDGGQGVGEAAGGEKMRSDLEAAKNLVIGEDPFHLEPLRLKIPEPRVYSPIEVACFDLMGKATGRPVCDLLGGKCRDHVPYSAYLFYKYASRNGTASVPYDDWGEVMSPEAMVEEAKRFVQTWGFKALKVKGGVLPPDEEIRTMKMLREAFGPEYKLRLDPNCIWSVETSIKVGQALEGYLEYLEDPTPTQAGMAQVHRHVNVPLSTNSCVTAWAHIPPAIKTPCVDCVLTDHHYWGGLVATMRLAHVCQFAGWTVSMHSNNHLGVSLAAMTHVAAAIPNLDHACDTHYPWQVEDVIKGERIEIVDGCVEVSDKPGLGVEVDEEKLAALHENYVRAKQHRRDDVSEMRKYDPTWEPKRPRW
jgi:glucarate dehydratase